MTPVIWSPQSLHDLESIRAYIAEDSAAYAELVVRRILAVVERLHTFPESGRVVPEREAPEIREVPPGTAWQAAGLGGCARRLRCSGG